MKATKILKITLLVTVITGILYVGDMFLGNPVSYGIVKWHSQKYLQEAYPNLDLRVNSIYHDWYNGGGYDVRVVSDTSRDTRFELIYGRLGQLRWDGYGYTVASGRATLSRLYEEYDALVTEALSEVPGEHIYHPGLSTIDAYTGTPVPLSVGIDMAALRLDGVYDVAAMGADYGYITLSSYVTEETLTVEHATEQLLQVKAALEKAGVGVYAIDLFMIVQDTKDPNRSIGINGITMADLETENVAARLEEMRLEQFDDWNSPKEE